MVLLVLVARKGVSTLWLILFVSLCIFLLGIFWADVISYFPV